MTPIIITPPLVQFNSPYPSGAYLKSFFSELGYNAHWDDLNISFFYELFSSTGIKRLFELSESKAIKIANQAELNNDKETAFNLNRYISSKEQWIKWIDWIVQCLTDGNKAFSTRELSHSFLFSPFVPRGSRMEQFLSTLSSTPSIDDIRFLCTLAIADLADYITVVFDSNFSLINYSTSVRYIKEKPSKIIEDLQSPILCTFYEDLLNRKYSKLDEKLLILISVPFEGCFIPALYTSKWFKNRYKENAYVVLGGGFINTELRDLKDTFYSDYFDALSYDRGYGSYKALFDNWKDNIKNEKIYKLRQFSNIVIEPLGMECNSLHKIKSDSKDDLYVKKYMEYEDEITRRIIPDYSNIDFSIYPRVCDDKNPMHRLWTDGTWIKVYLAHGCYWHKCAFCDTKLDYVCSYKPIDVEQLYKKLYQLSNEKGLNGIHFVDEAMPPKMLKQFALLNAQNQNKLYFWGNIRFEKTFNKDLAAFLSYCGLGAVSAGIEVATEVGLKNINKGTDIDTIVSACAAFKEAGILVHSYMIFGFWYDTPQSIIDSMETLRQFFSAGLLDSAFWHQFMLTKNSELYEKLKDNWKGGKEFEKFTYPLETALSYWMKGEQLNKKVQKWFDFTVPSPTVPQNYIEKSIEIYEKRNKLHNNNFENLEGLFWLGSRPLLTKEKNRIKITWFYLMEEEIEFLREDQLFICDLLWSLKPDGLIENRSKTLEYLTKNINTVGILKRFRERGLVLI